MDGHRRSIVKALSWRVVAVTITATITWFVTGSVRYTVLIGGADTVTKLIAYYFHERTWNHIRFGIGEQPEYYI